MFRCRARRRKDFASNAVSYYFSDHLKTASVITDSAGNITEDEDYYPWGGELQFVNNDSNHYKFTGKERDSETGLDYLGARHYANWLGRFVTPDWAAKPITVPYANFGDPQSLNLYGYVRNIPTSLIDGDGHGFWSDALDFTVGVARGFASSISYGTVGAPKSSDSTASLVGQAFGTAIEGAAGTITRNAGKGLVVGGLVAEGPSLGTSTVAVGVGVGGVVTGGAMEVGAAKNGAAIAHVMANKSGGTQPKNNLGGGQIGEPNGPKPGSAGGPSAGRRATPSERKQVLSENNGKCVFCGKDATEADHAFPRSRGGDRTPENRQPTCTSCNRSKGAQTLEEFLRKKNEEQK